MGKKESLRKWRTQPLQIQFAATLQKSIHTCVALECSQHWVLFPVEISEIIWAELRLIVRNSTWWRIQRHRNAVHAVNYEVLIKKVAHRYKISICMWSKILFSYWSAKHLISDFGSLRRTPYCFGSEKYMWRINAHSPLPKHLPFYYSPASFSTSVCWRKNSRALTLCKYHLQRYIHLYEWDTRPCQQRKWSHMHVVTLCDTGHKSADVTSSGPLLSSAHSQSSSSLQRPQLSNLNAIWCEILPLLSPPLSSWERNTLIQGEKEQ